MFYDRYAGVADFHKTIVSDAVAKGTLTTSHTPKGYPMHNYTKITPTQRRYVFSEYDSDYKEGASYSPTELKNWPVQGFATGDVVPHMVGLIVTKLYQSGGLQNHALPIMTVHDSIVFDVHVDSLDRFKKSCYTILSNTTELVNNYFQMYMPVKLSVGCSVGINWQDLIEQEM